jgi:hypothetical protein
VDNAVGARAASKAESTSGIAGESVALRFRWRDIGDVVLDPAAKLAFPRAAAEPGIYRLEVDHAEASVYFGEASDLRRRFGQYRNPGPSQQTNQRLNDLLGRVLANSGRCRVSVVEVQWFEGKFREVDLDLRLKAARVLVESAAIVLARSDGKRIVLDLDEAFDRALGGR